MHISTGYFFSPSSDLRRAVVSFWWKNMHKYWSGLSLPRQVWLGKLTSPTWPYTKQVLHYTKQVLHVPELFWIKVPILTWLYLRYFLFFFFWENRFSHFSHANCLLGDNLHEISKPYILRKNRINCSKMLCSNFLLCVLRIMLGIKLKIGSLLRSENLRKDFQLPAM